MTPAPFIVFPNPETEKLIRDFDSSHSPTRHSFLSNQLTTFDANLVVSLSLFLLTSSYIHSHLSTTFSTSRHSLHTNFISILILNFTLISPNAQRSIDGLDFCDIFGYLRFTFQ